MKYKFCVVAILLVVAGCTSFSSTPITRLPGGFFSGDSNGKLKLGLRARPHKGMPVRLKVVTHTDVYIKETLLFAKRIDNSVYQLFPETRQLSVEAKPVVTEQVVMVDFKRPASGTLGLQLELTDEQYFQKIVSALEDTTLKDSATLVNSILNAVVTSDAGNKQLNVTNLEEVTRTVAYQRFDVSAVDYEDQLEAFVNHHLNNCNQCAGSPGYDTNALSNP